MTFAGTPTAIEKSSTSFVTIDPAPIMQNLPIFTPGNIVVLAPIHVSSPIVIVDFLIKFSFTYEISFKFVKSYLKSN